LVGENKMNEILYSRSINDKCIQTAKLRLLGIGKYAFETSLFGEKPFELNMNMPFFDTEKQAYKWIENTGKWHKS
jgi:hypothetical protein